MFTTNDSTNMNNSNMADADAANYPEKVELLRQVAKRIAQVFNAPPLAPLHFLQEADSWLEALVYEGKLNHFGDRLQDEYCRRRIDADTLTFPEWRYQSFLGTIRVPLEDGSLWRVAILAPSYFIWRLMYYSEWYTRNGQIPVPGTLMLTGTEPSEWT